MFGNKKIAILDVGSQCLRVYIGVLNKAGDFNTLNTSEVVYDSFAGDEWLDEQGLIGNIKHAVDLAMDNGKFKFSKIYVGVPAEFTKLAIKEINASFPSLHKLNAKELDRLYTANMPQALYNGYQFVDYACVSAKLDGIKTNNIIDMLAKQVNLTVSYMAIQDGFVTKINAALCDYTTKIKYVISPYTEALALMPFDKRDQGVILCDVGYISTSIIYIRGDGLVELSTIPLGGGYVEYDLSYGLDISYPEAVELKPKINLNLLSMSSDYHIKVDGADNYLKIETVHEIAKARLIEIVQAIGEEINKFKYQYPDYLKLYVTGSGICDIHGVKKLFTSELNRSAEIIAPIKNGMDKPKYSRVVGLVEFIKRDKARKFKLF